MVIFANFDSKSKIGDQELTASVARIAMEFENNIARPLKIKCIIISLDIFRIPKVNLMIFRIFWFDY